MPKSYFAVAVSVIVLLASADIAAAQQQKKKKLSYEEAWKLCAAEINKAACPYRSARFAASSGRWLHEKVWPQDIYPCAEFLLMAVFRATHGKPCRGRGQSAPR